MRSIPAAAALTVLALVGAAVADLICIGIGHSLAGATGSFVGAIVAVIAALSFMTLRAYPEPSRRPMRRLVLMAVLLTPVLPLIETSWVWARHGGGQRTPSPGASRPRDLVAEAWRLLNDGETLEAAAVIWDARSAAIEEHDAKKIERLDLFVSRAREHLEGEDLERFDAIVSGQAPALPWLADPEPDDTTGADQLDMSPLGFGLAVAGAAAVAIAVFLPQASSTTFGEIVHNTLIQNGDGWIFLLVALGELGTIYRAYATRRPTWWPLVAGALLAGGAVYEGTSSSTLRVCSVLVPTSCERASPGIGIYLAGLGGVLMFIGGWQLGKAAPAASTREPATPPAPAVVGDPPAAAAVAYCTLCGHAFAAADQFCGGCGAPRTAPRPAST